MEAMPETEKQVGPWANIGQPFWMGLGWMNGESSESSKRPETFQVGEGFRGESWNPTMKDTVENQCRSSVCDVSFGTGNKGKAFEKSSFFFNSSVTCSSLFYAVEIELSWIVCMSSILWMELITFSQRFYWPSSIGSGATTFGARILDTRKTPELGDVQKMPGFFSSFFP